MELTDFQWLNKSEWMKNGSEIAIYAPAKTDYFNNPRPGKRGVHETPGECSVFPH